MNNDLLIRQRRRDRMLRARLLLSLFVRRGGPMRGEAGVAGLMRDANLGTYGEDRLSDKHHAMELLRDLVNGGYAEERLTGKEDCFTDDPDRFVYRITDRGTNLYLREIPYDPKIADPRNPEED